MSNFELKEEQRRAIYDGDGKNLMVSASAGSGKTFVMIERIIRLIREKKLTVNGLLAVTFTEKATFEMREKLSDALIESINQGEKSFKKELLDLPMADICTIDAFCSRLVKRYFYKLGIDRDFEILSDIERNKLSSEAMSKVFDKYYLEQSPDFLRVVSRYAHKRSDRALREQIERIYLFTSSEENSQKWFDLTDALYTENGLMAVEDRFFRSIKKQIKTFCSTIEEFQRVATENGFIDCVEYGDALKDYLTAFSEVNDLYSLAKIQLDAPVFPRAKKPEEDHKKYRNDFKDYCKKQLEKIQDGICLVVNQDVARQRVLDTYADYSVIKNLVLDYEELFNSLKREENKFEFHDISRFALQLLKDEEVRLTVRAKYDNIFIDEYQDVNAVQEQIFDLISNDNCFMVGDVKQSIYGFRGCNCKLFEEKFKKLSKTGNTVWLNHNFRSANAILDTANKIFDGIITAEDFGVDYKDAMLLPGGTYASAGDGRVKFHIVTKPKKQKQSDKVKVYDILEDINGDEVDEEDLTALKVKEIILEELGKTYYDMKSRTEKKVTLSDIAVLTRNKTNIAINLVGGLGKHGIRVVSEVESNCLEVKEVKLLIDYLKLLSCFEQERPLAVCMLSPIGNFTATELSEIKSYSTDNDVEEKFLDGYNIVLGKNGELADKVREFDKYIKEQRFIADYYGAKTALEKVIRDKNITAHALVKKLGEDRARKIERFLFEGVSANRELSVDEFLYKIKNSPSSFVLAETSGGDAVTLITSHKSKGLEYPVVIIVGMQSKFNLKDCDDKILLDRDGGMALYNFDDDARCTSKNILREGLKHQLSQRLAQDEVRLFYVATTRAKFSMHMVAVEDKIPFGALKRNEAKKPIDYIPDSIVPTVTLGEDLISSQASPKPQTVVVGKKNEDLCSIVKQNLSFVYPFEREVSLPLKTSVTANLDADGAILVEEVIGHTEDEPIVKKRITTDEGIVAHKIMEHYDFSSNDDFDVQIKKMLTLGVITNEELSLINSDNLKKAINLSVFKALKGYSLYKEQYFVCKLPAKEVLDDYNGEELILMQGVIDLLAVKDGDAIIIDYKYSGKSKEKLLQTYAKQLRLYKRAVEVSLGISVSRTALVSLLSGETVEVDA